MVEVVVVVAVVVDTVVVIQCTFVRLPVVLELFVVAVGVVVAGIDNHFAVCQMCANIYI